MITERRLEKIGEVAAYRQNMTVILENVHDPHNIGAVMRSCDAIGIQDIYILTTDPRVRKKNALTFKYTSTGVKKWLSIHHYEDVDLCFKEVKSKYDTIYATHISEPSISLYDIELTGRVAFLFGNEHDGLSAKSLSYADSNFVIPQYGMVQSLNISVACALTVFEAGRQRINKGMYNADISKASDYNKDIFNYFERKHREAYKK